LFAGCAVRAGSAYKMSVRSALSQLTEGGEPPLAAGANRSGAGPKGQDAEKVTLLPPIKRVLSKLPSESGRSTGTAYSGKTWGTKGAKGRSKRGGSRGSASDIASNLRSLTRKTLSDGSDSYSDTSHNNDDRKRVRDEVISVYQKVLGRKPDPAGLSHYSACILDGEMKTRQLIQQVWGENGREETTERRYSQERRSRAPVPVRAHNSFFPVSPSLGLLLFALSRFFALFSSLSLSRSYSLALAHSLARACVCSLSRTRALSHTQSFLDPLSLGRKPTRSLSLSFAHTLSVLTLYPLSCFRSSFLSRSLAFALSCSRSCSLSYLLKPLSCSRAHARARALSLDRLLSFSHPVPNEGLVNPTRARARSLSNFVRPIRGKIDCSRLQKCRLGNTKCIYVCVCMYIYIYKCIQIHRFMYVYVYLYVYISLCV